MAPRNGCAETYLSGVRLISERLGFVAVTEPSWHLAQVNVATLLAPLTSPQLAGFVGRLDEITALADDAPGFVWRLQTEDGDATAIRAFDDDRILVNMSVWENIHALGGFVYGSPHLEVLRRRRDWFARMTTPILALWWVPAGARSRPWTRRSAGSSCWSG